MIHRRTSSVGTYLVTVDEGSAGLRRLAGRSVCAAIVLMDIEAQDERIPLAASLPVPVMLIGVADDPLGLQCVELDFVLPAWLAVDERADTGHERVVWITHPPKAVQRDLDFVRRLQRPRGPRPSGGGGRMWSSRRSSARAPARRRSNALSPLAATTGAVCWCPTARRWSSSSVRSTGAASFPVATCR